MAIKSQQVKEYAGEVVLIDQDRLDRECIRLPGDYLKFAHLAAEAKLDVDEMKAEFEVMQADMARRVQSHPDKYGFEGTKAPAQQAITAVVMADPKYLEAVSKLNRAHYRFGLLQATVNALETKKRTLTLLVELHGRSYFSSPKISEKGRASLQKIKDSHGYRPLSREDE